MHSLFRRFFALLFLVTLLTAATAPGRAAPGIQRGSPSAMASALLETLTPEERVGQLFLISFQGTDVGPQSAIYDLIANHYIGGVVFDTAYNNFPAGDQALEQVQAMVRDMQAARQTAAETNQTNPNTNETFTPAFVPLLVAAHQGGDGNSNEAIVEGMTPLPSQMALGATWRPDLAEQVGSVLGQELAALGINTLIGPSLDVLDIPPTYSPGDLGIRTFGGDPYWVGEMGSAYIRGIHTGSGSKIAVIATHFPGHGSSDRLPEQEVATIRRSFEQLQSFDLLPFFRVTGSLPAPNTADALLVSHVRLQGFQGGNFRGVTRPFSFDPAVFAQLTSLDQISSWRQNGGVMISDDLGGPAIRGYYDLTSQPYDARRVTLNAFLAGNDMLYVSDFSSINDADSYTAAVRTLEFFTQKYRSEQAFAERVDQSVLSILTLKYRMFGDFALEAVLPPAGALENVGQGGQITFDVARQAATLVSPGENELDSIIPDPPNGNDRIVFITDARTTKACSQCPPRQQLSADALQKVVAERYGPNAGSLISPNNLSSYSLQELQEMLAAPKNTTAMETDLGRAHWIVFTMLDASDAYPSYSALRRFLAERPDLFQQKRMIVFALNAPYYLDATNISKLTAYYALYSRTPQFIEMAAYLLFQELPAAGSLPVSVSGIGYNLYQALLPNPNQTIPLFIGEIAQPQGTATPAPQGATPEPQVVRGYHLGDALPLRTGTIVDTNGHVVPDGTEVEFIYSLGGELLSNRQVEYTRSGVAQTTFIITNAGALEVRAVSGLARSATLRLEIPAANGVTVQPTVTPTITPTVTPTPTLTPTATPGETIAPVERRPRINDWMMSILIAASVAWVAYRLAVQIGQVRWGVRAGFLALTGGLLAYSYLALKMPGSEEVLKQSVARGVLVTTLLGAGVGLAAAWGWRMYTTRENRQTSPRS